MKKLNSLFYYIICYLPWLYLFCFYSFVLRAYFKLGYLPFYNNPDPITLGFSTHMNIIYIIGDACVYASIMWVIILIVRKLKMPRWSVILYLVGMLLFVYNLLIDPFMEWFAD